MTNSGQNDGTTDGTYNCGADQTIIGHASSGGGPLVPIVGNLEGDALSGFEAVGGKLVRKRSRDHGDGPVC